MSADTVNVPREPTEAMVAAGSAAAAGCGGWIGDGRLIETYKAMLAASTPVGGWEDISTAPNNTDHMRPILLFWKSAGVGLGWYDVDDDYATRPASWRCPETGWICEGDQCIPINQEDCTHWMPLPPPPSVSTGSRPQEAVPTEQAGPAVVGSEKWEWWASRDEENYTVGPEGSRADVVAAALCDFDGEPFHVVEACKGSMASYLPSGQRIIEWMQECADDNGAFGDDQYCELTGSAEAIAAAEGDATAALADWLARHAAIFPTPWAFRATRNAEWISPAEVGAQALTTPQPADGCSSNEGAAASERRARCRMAGFGNPADQPAAA